MDAFQNYGPGWADPIKGNLFTGPGSTEYGRNAILVALARVPVAPWESANILHAGQVENPLNYVSVRARSRTAPGYSQYPGAVNVQVIERDTTRYRVQVRGANG